MSSVINLDEVKDLEVNLSAIIEDSFIVPLETNKKYLVADHWSVWFGDDLSW